VKCQGKTFELYNQKSTLGSEVSSGNCSVRGRGEYRSVIARNENITNDVDSVLLEIGKLVFLCGLA
jgi:hypothetical protein